MPLAEYRRKRNFAETPEPVGRVRRAGRSPIFVVQKHDASRLHFAFSRQAPKPFAGLTQKPPCEDAHPLPELAAPELSRRVVVPAGFRATPLLTAQEEKQQRQQRADQQARGQGEIEGKVAALDEDVAGQAPEPGDPPPF